jgi:hypothetical protein
MHQELTVSDRKRSALTAPLSFDRCPLGAARAVSSLQLWGVDAWMTFCRAAFQRVLDAFSYCPASLERPCWHSCCQTHHFHRQHRLRCRDATPANCCSSDGHLATCTMLWRGEVPMPPRHDRRRLRSFQAVYSRLEASQQRVRFPSARQQ